MLFKLSQCCGFCAFVKSLKLKGLLQCSIIGQGTHTTVLHSNINTCSWYTVCAIYQSWCSSYETVQSM